MIQKLSTAGSAGKWSQIKGIRFEVEAQDGPDGVPVMARGASVYANGHHQAILHINLELTDDNNHNLEKVDWPDPQFVFKSFTLTNYDSGDALSTEGGKEWYAVPKRTAFTSPPLLEGQTWTPSTDPHSLKSCILTGGENGAPTTAKILYYVSCSGGKSIGSINVGFEVALPSDDPDVDGPIVVNGKDGSFHEPVTIAALQQLDYDTTDLEWHGDVVAHDNEKDTGPWSINTADPDGNYWRQFDYNVGLKNAALYSPGSIKGQFQNKLFRGLLDSTTPYVSSDGNYDSHYSFGEISNGLYNAKGYFWPNNVYDEASCFKANGTPIINPPQDTYENAMYGGDGLDLVKNEGTRGTGRYTATVGKSENLLYFSLFMYFGWTASLNFQKYPFLIAIYDQYGNKGEFVVDPELLTTSYVLSAPTSTKTVSPRIDATPVPTADLTFLTLSTGIVPDKSEGGPRNVFFNLVEQGASAHPGTSYGAYCVKNGGVTSVRTVQGLSGAAYKSKPYGFRLYRTDSSLLNYEQTYKIAWAQHVDVSLSHNDLLSLSTDQTLPDDTKGSLGPAWGLKPIWENNTFTIWSPNSYKYLYIDIARGVASAKLKQYSDDTGTEWGTAMFTGDDPAIQGDPDTGDGGDLGIYSTPDPENGRESWIDVGEITIDTGTLPGTIPVIFSNGSQQAVITVTVILKDDKNNPLISTTQPTVEYVKKAFSIIDYETFNPVERHENKGWAWSYDPNTFTNHMQEAGLIDANEYLTSKVKDGIATLIFYVTCDNLEDDVTRTFGLECRITDPAWGIPKIIIDGNGKTENKSFSIKTRKPVSYSASDFDCIATDKSTEGLPDDSPATINGREDPNNFWRRWDYKIVPKDTSTVKIKNYQMTSGLISPGIQTVSSRFNGLYSHNLFAYPLNMVDEDGHDLEPDQSKGGNTRINYTLSVRGLPDMPVSFINSSIDVNAIYLTLLSSFGFENGYGPGNYPLNLKVQDQFGNNSYIYIDPFAVPYVYHKEVFRNLNFVADGDSDPKGSGSVNAAIYQLSSCHRIPSDFTDPIKEPINTGFTLYTYGLAFGDSNEASYYSIKLDSPKDMSSIAIKDYNKSTLNSDRKLIISTKDTSGLDVPSAYYLIDKSSAFDDILSNYHLLSSSGDGGSLTGADDTTVYFKPIWESQLFAITPVDLLDAPSTEGYYISFPKEGGLSDPDQANWDLHIYLQQYSKDTARWGLTRIKST